MYPMRIKSSLDKSVTNRLSNVYHRPQQSGGVITERHNHEPRPFDRVSDAPKTSRENPARDLMRDFEANGVDSQIFCKEYVVTYNHQHRKTADDLERAIKRYHGMMEFFNLCWKCDRPIKVQKGSLKRRFDENGLPVNPTEPRNLSQPIAGKVAMFPTDEHDVFVDKMRKRKVSNGIWEHEFSSVQFKDARKSTTDYYGVVKSHFEVRQTADGKMIYKWIDGTGRNIQVRQKELTFRVKRRKFGKLRNVTKKRKLQYLVHVLANGKEYALTECPCNTCKSLKNPMPIDYHVSLKCECKAR